MVTRMNQWVLAAGSSSAVHLRGWVCFCCGHSCKPKACTPSNTRLLHTPRLAARGITLACGPGCAPTTHHCWSLLPWFAVVAAALWESSPGKHGVPRSQASQELLSKGSRVRRPLGAEQMGLAECIKHAVTISFNLAL